MPPQNAMGCWEWYRWELLWHTMTYYVPMSQWRCHHQLTTPGRMDHVPEAKSSWTSELPSKVKKFLKKVSKCIKAHEVISWGPISSNSKYVIFVYICSILFREFQNILRSRQVDLGQNSTRYAEVPFGNHLPWAQKPHQEHLGTSRNHMFIAVQHYINIPSPQPSPSKSPSSRS